MGSGLPTRKSVLNHSMTSNFCLLYKHKLKHKRAFCRRLRWRGGTELRGNFVLTQFTNRGGLSSAVGIRSPTYRFASQVSLSDLPLMFTHCASTLSLVNHLLLIWGGQVHAFLDQLSIWMYWTLGFLPVSGRRPFWLESQVYYQRWLVERVTAKGWSLNIKYLTVNKCAVFRILRILLIQ